MVHLFWISNLSSYFYPRPPRGGRRCSNLTSLYANDISIHALREEGDFSDFNGYPNAIKFLSTPSARRATTCHAAGILLLRISIHALREEGDFP